MIRIAILIMFLFGTLLPVSGQNTIGFPEITNYNTLQFHAGTQTWDLQQDKNGILYFANNEGLLTFNGAYWKLFPVPNKTIVRSIAIDSGTGRIYAGAQDEIGYYEPDQNGNLQYNSLKNLIPAPSGQFSDVWNVILYQNAVFFRTYDRIFMLRDGKIQVFTAPAEWEILAKAGNRLFAKDKERGLLYFNNGIWQPETAAASINNLLVTAILPFRTDTLMVMTLKNGIFLLHNHQLTPWPTQSDQQFREERIYCARQINDNWFAIGTTSGGCSIVDHQGRVIQQLTRTEGLQNNNVLSLFVDRNQNLWMGLDNGIDLVAFNAAIKHIYPDRDNPITGYAIRIFNNYLYIGTSNGTYSVELQPKESDLSFSKGNFIQLPDTKGQVWNFSEVNGHLLMGHHEGAFEIKNNRSYPLMPGTSSWLFTPLSPIEPSEHVLAGTYTGLQYLSYKNGVFKNEGKIEGITESLRFISVDNNTIWASHPYRGVFKIQLSDDHKHVKQVELFTQKEGLPTSLNNYVHIIHNRVVTATEKGVYEYDAVRNRFIPSAFFVPIFNKETVRYLKEDGEGNIWFITNQRVGVVDFRKPLNGNPYSVVYFPELDGRIVTGFEHIYPYNSNNIFIGARKGVYHINYNKYTNTGTRLNVLLSAVKIIDTKDSVIFGGYNNGQDEISLPNKTNSFHFEYASPAYRQENIEFSYRLEGFDKEWSTWSTRTEKDYTNLPYGTYTFMVKVHNNLGNESLPASYRFKVRPAWYQTNWALTGYFLIFCALIYALAKWQRRKLFAQQLQYEEEQRKIKYLHSLELDRNENEIMKLQNDKLESDVVFKNRELATATMHLVERGKLMSKIREELIQVLKNIQKPEISDAFKSIMRLLNDAEKSDDDWEHFAVHFDEVHSDFLSNLKNRYPQLSATDLKLCAYLRMNLSSKEIAQLMNISLKGVEVSRSRLRKKLQLTPDINLFNFLIQTVTL